MKSSNFVAGAIIVLVGIIFLGINFGWWNSEVWSDLWRLWPVLLIIAGLRQVVRNEGLFIILAFFALAAGYILVGNARFPAGPRLSITSIPTPSLDVTVEPTPPTIKEKLGEALGLSKPEESQMNEFKSQLKASEVNALAIQLSRNYDITLTGTDSDFVTVDLKGEQKILDDLSLTPESGQIVLKDVIREGANIFTDKEKITGTITIPRTLALDMKLSGIVKIKVESVTSNLKIDASGGSTVTFSQSTSREPVITLNGTSKVTLDQCSGVANFDLNGVAMVTGEKCELSSLTAKADGTSSIDIKSGSIVDLKANASGVAKIKVPKPSGTLEANNSGVSSINYY